MGKSFDGLAAQIQERSSAFSIEDKHGGETLHGTDTISRDGDSKLSYEDVSFFTVGLKNWNSLFEIMLVE